MDKDINKEGIIGYYSICEYKNSITYFGNKKGYLFNLKPNFNIFRSKSDCNYIYMNQK